MVNQHMDEWKDGGRSGPVQIYLGSPQSKDRTSIKEAKRRMLGISYREHKTNEYV